MKQEESFSKPLFAFLAVCLIAVGFFCSRDPRLVELAGFQAAQPGRVSSRVEPGHPPSFDALRAKGQQLPSAPAAPVGQPPGCQRMLWFTGMGAGPASISNDYEAFIQAALLSAKEHAPSLVPVLLYCGKPGNLTRWFTRNGGTVILHRASFLQDFDVQPNVHFREDLKKNEGAFLRLDIPLVMESIISKGLVDLTNVSTTHVLYTDTDVMFVGGDVSTCTMPLPSQLSMSPQHAKGTAENSGVLVFNVPSFKEEFPAFLNYGREKRFEFGAYDNGWLTSYRINMNKTWGALPDAMNWKAYWGSDAGVTPTILHWHGPKPRRGNCIECFVRHGRQEGWEKHAGCGKCLPIYVGMVNMGNSSDGGDMYAHMLAMFEQYAQAAQML